MKLSSVEAFVAVVRAGSIHAGARDLGISQPALSKGLRALEEDLAAPLLIRSSHGVEPNEYGKAFYQRARVVIEELRKAREEVVQLTGKLEGRLTVAIAPASTIELAPMVFKDFCRSCPDVELHIIEGIWPAIAEPLRDGTIDLALGPVMDNMPRAEMVAEDLIKMPMSIVVRPEHPLARATSLTELSKARWLHQGVGETVNILIQRIFADLNMPVPPVSVASRSVTATILMLQSMDLITMLPSAMLASDSIKGSLVAINLKEPLKPTQLGLIYRANRPLTRVAQVFATHTRRAAAHLELMDKAKSAAPAMEQSSRARL